MGDLPGREGLAARRGRARSPGEPLGRSEGGRVAWAGRRRAGRRRALAEKVLGAEDGEDDEKDDQQQSCRPCRSGMPSCRAVTWGSVGPGSRRAGGFWRASQRRFGSLGGARRARTGAPPRIRTSAGSPAQQAPGPAGPRHRRAPGSAARQEGIPGGHGPRSSAADHPSRRPRRLQRQVPSRRGPAAPGAPASPAPGDPAPSDLPSGSPANVLAPSRLQASRPGSCPPGSPSPPRRAASAPTPRSDTPTPSSPSR